MIKESVYRNLFQGEVAYSGTLADDTCTRFGWNEIRSQLCNLATDIVALRLKDYASNVCR